MIAKRLHMEQLFSDMIRQIGRNNAPYLPFIGCVVGAFLILMVSPLQAVGFLILFLVLQQIEGNLIYPKVGTPCRNLFFLLFGSFCCTCSLVSEIHIFTKQRIAGRKQWDK